MEHFVVGQPSFKPTKIPELLCQLSVPKALSVGHLAPPHMAIPHFPGLSPCL